jgi:carboxypeptidase family protein
MVWAACVTALLVAVVPALGQPTGSLVGRVRLDGKPPTRPRLQVSKNREVCGTSAVDDRLVVGPGGGVRWAIVTVDGAKSDKRLEGDPGVVLDNHSCRFAPHVLVAEVGQTLDIHNSDPIIHNAHARVGTETLFNYTLGPDTLIRRPLTRSGLISFTCDIRHTWMSAYVSVAEHPFQAVTDAYGEYQIDDLPPGTYRLRVWHEELGTLEQPVAIEAGGVASVDFKYPVPVTPEARGRQ